MDVRSSSIASGGVGRRRAAPGLHSVLVKLLGAAGAVPEITLTSVNFSGGREIRVNLSAPNFQSVEQVREQLGQRSLQASLESSMRVETALWRDCGWRSDHASVVRIASQSRSDCADGAGAAWGCGSLCS